MAQEIENVGWRCLWPAGCTLGEGPIWDARTGVVRFVDIEQATLHRFDPTTGDHASWSAPCRVGSIAVRVGGGLVAGTEHGFALIDPEASSFRIIDQPESHLPDNRFNDGKVDPHGIFWAGTMDDRKQARSGTLYALHPDHRWDAIDLGYRITNGPTFSLGGDVLYHSDTLDRTTFAFDLGTGGTVRGKRVFRRWDDVTGNPDGMTTDAEGNLWIAFWGGWCVRRVSPTGEVLGEYPLPVSNVTSVAFGGPAFDRLIVTSARAELDAAALDRQPLAGGLFEITGHGTRGLDGGVWAG
ncbi:MAG: SMP-30/gluconolactonase/LRE family protein [Sphingomonadaceae bacterium]|nr:SMP-30/gluconolactonase/LRE family protein [Sphingomonadaceae bacterium]